MSDETPRIKLAQLVSLQELNAVTWNEALAQLDAFVDLVFLGQYVNAPPASPSDGDAYLIGGTPTGAWSGYAYKIASCLDGAWRFYTPFNGLRAYVAPSGAFIVYLNGSWTDWNSLISANEVSIASAATCDLGVADALFVQITGNTTITSFGASTNKLRFVRFGGALTLTHNATSLVLLGGVNRTTAAGDVGIYASDAGGNWRERAFFRAGANPADVATRSGAETLSNKTLASPAFSGTATNFRSTGFQDNASTSALHIDGSNNVIFGSAANLAEAAVTYVFPAPLNGVMSTFTNGADAHLKLFVTAAGAATKSCGMGTTGNVPVLFYGGWGSEAARFDTTLNFLPGADNAYSLGASARRWSVVFAGTATINTSDAAQKTNVRKLSETEIACALEIQEQACVYQWLDAVARKGETARLHAGFVANANIAHSAVGAVEAICRRHGIDAGRWGFFCKDPVMKTITKSRRVLRQKIERRIRPVEKISVSDSIAILTLETETYEAPVFEALPLKDGDGSIVCDNDGVPRTYANPVMAEVEEAVTEEVADTNPDGSPKYVYGLRYTELREFIAAAEHAARLKLETRVAALERALTAGPASDAARP